jgi:hypothetical protein
VPHEEATSIEVTSVVVVPDERWPQFEVQILVNFEFNHHSTLHARQALITIEILRVALEHGEEKARIQPHKHTDDIPMHIL